MADTIGTLFGGCVARECWRMWSDEDCIRHLSYEIRGVGISMDGRWFISRQPINGPHRFIVAFSRYESLG